LTPALLPPREDATAAATLGLQPPRQILHTANQLLAALPHDEYPRLAPHLVRVRLVREQVLVERGQAAEHVYFLESGLALVVASSTASSPPLQVAMIGREAAVGGIALLDPTSATCAAVVMQIAGTAYRVPIAVMARIVNESPGVRAVMMRSVQTLARQVMEMAAWNASATVQQRYVRWLLMAHARLDSDEIGITHESVSSILGVRRSAVTITAAALQRQGLVRTSRGRVTILDRSGLAALVDMGGPAGATKPMEREGQER
jgi:CRP-like cAMP-binding protein